METIMNPTLSVCTLGLFGLRFFCQDSDVDQCKRMLTKMKSMYSRIRLIRHRLKRQFAYCDIDLSAPRSVCLFYSHRLIRQSAYSDIFLLVPCDVVLAGFYCISVPPLMISEASFKTGLRHSVRYTELWDMPELGIPNVAVFITHI